MTKREAAIEQVKKLREAKVGTAEIRTQLLATGMTVAQVDDVCPDPDAQKPTVVPRGTMDQEDRLAVLDATINFLDSIGMRVNRYADRYPDLATLRNECTGASRRLAKLK